MHRIPVVSTNVAAIGYDAPTLVLEVQFHTGSVYQYSGVPGDIYQAFISAGSKGRFFDRMIRGRFGYRRVS